MEDGYNEAWRKFIVRLYRVFVKRRKQNVGVAQFLRRRRVCRRPRRLHRVFIRVLLLQISKLNQTKKNSLRGNQ